MSWQGRWLADHQKFFPSLLLGMQLHYTFSASLACSSHVTNFSSINNEQNLREQISLCLLERRLLALDFCYFPFLEECGSRTWKTTCGEPCDTGGRTATSWVSDEFVRAAPSTSNSSWELLTCVRNKHLCLSKLTLWSLVIAS